MMSSLSSSFPSRIIQMVQRPYIWAYYIIFQSLVYHNLSDHGAEESAVRVLRRDGADLYGFLAWRCLDRQPHRGK